MNETNPQQAVGAPLERHVRPLVEGDTLMAVAGPVERRVRPHSVARNDRRTTRTTLALPIPLENGRYLAQLVVPSDLQQHEADKLCAVLQAFVAPQVHEDELPPMTDEQYDAWFAVSYIPDGVGCRMGPAVSAA